MFNLFKKKEEIHDWDYGFLRLTKDHKNQIKTSQCKDCRKFKEEITPVIKPREAQIE